MKRHNIKKLLICTAEKIMNISFVRWVKVIHLQMRLLSEK